jgi:hypothetical protein
MAETIKGIQDAGTIACAKHFIGNEQEHFRETSSSNIDDVTMHELYLWYVVDLSKLDFANPLSLGKAICGRSQGRSWFYYVQLQPSQQQLRMSE